MVKPDTSHSNERQRGTAARVPLIQLPPFHLAAGIFIRLTLSFFQLVMEKEIIIIKQFPFPLITWRIIEYSNQEKRKELVAENETITIQQQLDLCIKILIQC